MALKIGNKKIQGPEDVVLENLQQQKDKLANTPKGFGGGSFGGTGVSDTPKASAPIVTPLNTTGQGGKQGYNVNVDNKNYPTTNPNFIPDPNTTQLKFNQNGSVDISPKGSDQSINLTAEEYKQTLVKPNVAQLGQAPTPNLEALRLAEKGTTPGMDIQGEYQKQIGALPPSVDLRNSQVGEILNRNAGILEKASSFLPSFLRFGATKGKDVIQAEQTFNSIAGTIDDDIKLLQTGTISKSQVEMDIQQAITATTSLYQQTKGMGQADLRFWLDKGKEIEAQINQQLRSLENKQRMINALP